ncbi:MAG: 23S rRNA (guanosine(2251)-2'-O)-methyltransferase RlmB [Oscillospiraceae bacterium]|nr:23S rRNA (guanosine(2251)-2'-O)-methyltransferase RlmB [Oscillospiraceae bacterium]
MEKTEQQADATLIFGKNAVTEALRAQTAVDTLYVCRTDDKSVGYIVSLAREKGAVIKNVPPVKLDRMCGSDRHQGVAAVCAACTYSELDDVFALAAQRGEAPFILMADDISDPHNLGAMLRTAECAGVHGVIIPKRGGCTVTAAVHRASAGAASHIPVVRASNLASTLRELKQRGVFCYCADGAGEDCYSVDLTGACALVVGSEGFGVSRLLRELCDKTVRIPQFGMVNSLNASVAAGVLIYEIRRQRTAVNGGGNNG